MSLAPGLRLGPYEVTAPLGAGGMGDVYRARDTRLGRDVASKVLPSTAGIDADRLARFEQEARAAAWRLVRGTIRVKTQATEAKHVTRCSELDEGSGWSGPLGYNAPQINSYCNAGGGLSAGALMDVGYTMFVLSYRASPRFQCPAAVEDVQRAVRFIRTNARRFGIRPNEIGAIGGSSGGHLVSTLGVLDGAGDPDDPINRASSKVQAVIALSTPYDLKRVNTTLGGERVSLFLGVARPAENANPGPANQARSAPGSSENKRYAAASPIAHVTPDDPPFLLFHGDADEVIPFEQPQLMETELKGVGVLVKFVPVAGGRHGNYFQLAADDPRLAANDRQVVEWFDTHLRKLSR